MMKTFKMSIWGRKETPGGRLGADKVKTKKMPFISIR